MKLYDSLVTYGLITSPDGELVDRLVAHYSLPPHARDTVNFHYQLAARPDFQWLFSMLKQYGEPETDRLSLGDHVHRSSVRGVWVPDLLIAVNDPICGQNVLNGLLGSHIGQMERVPVCFDQSADRLWVRVRFDLEWYCARGVPPGVPLVQAVAYVVEERLRETN